MRVIFMGTPEFAVGTLYALAEAGHEICLAVTQPDRPKGRGEKMQFPPVKEAALKLGIPVFQPRQVRKPECVEELRKYGADLIVVVAFGQILPREILEMTPYGCVNIHASLLPKYRGAAPIQWAILDGEQVTGVTSMQMDEGLDTGDMLLKTEVPIEPEDTGDSLHDKLAKAGAALAVRTLEALAAGTLHPQKQGETTTHYAKMLDKKMGNIVWSDTAEKIERLVRGLNSWPGAYTYWNGKMLKIWKASAVKKTGPETKEGMPGTLVRTESSRFFIQTGAGLLAVEEVQLPGKKRMKTDAFLRGCPLKEGTVFTDNPM